MCCYIACLLLVRNSGTVRKPIFTVNLIKTADYPKLLGLKLPNDDYNNYCNTNSSLRHKLATFAYPYNLLLIHSFYSISTVLSVLCLERAQRNKISEERTRKHALIPRKGRRKVFQKGRRKARRKHQRLSERSLMAPERV